MEKKNKRYECCCLSPFSSPPSQCSFGPLSRRRIINFKMKNILRPRRTKRAQKEKKNGADDTIGMPKGHKRHAKNVPSLTILSRMTHRRSVRAMPVHVSAFAVRAFDCSSLQLSLCLPACDCVRVCVGLSQYEMVIGCTVFSLVLLCNNLMNARARTPEQVRHKGTTIKMPRRCK